MYICFRQLCASVRSLMLLPDLNPNISIATSQSLYITTSLPPNPHIPMKMAKIRQN